MTKRDTLVLGQRVYDTPEDFSLMAEEAISTTGVMLYPLCVAAIRVYEIAACSKQQKEFGYNFAAMATFRAGFLEGVRTQKQKQRERRQKKSRLAMQTLGGKH